jgi:hypothetical protein
MSFAGALRTTRSTVDVSLVNEELARSFQDLVKSIFKKSVRRSGERRTAMSCRGLAFRPAAHFILVRFHGVGGCVQEHVKRSHRSCGIQDVRITTVPIDLASTGEC